ncbi:MAG: lysylphosphatidylglycerol synthase transmembrane domain-containing protein [Desulfobacteraceae bacterium]
MHDPVKATGIIRRLCRKSWRWLLAVLGLALAWHALKETTWDGVWDLLIRLNPAAILMLLGYNLILLPMMTARWWLLIKSLGGSVSLGNTCMYRLAANAVSYLTPGPHFGGEPLSVYCLHQRHDIPLPSAGASVAVDRLLELFASFGVLTFCLIHLSLSGSGILTGSREITVAIALLVAACCILAALFTGKRPFSRLMTLFKRLDHGSFPRIFKRIESWIAVIARSEDMAASLYRDHRRLFLLANLISLAQWFGVFVEFWLMARLLGTHLSFVQLTAVVMVARMAFFTPIPAGIGVLESVLPWLTALLGLGHTLGFSLCLMIRSRDLLFNLTGLGLTVHYLTCRKSAGIISRI